MLYCPGTLLNLICQKSIYEIIRNDHDRKSRFDNVDIFFSYSTDLFSRKEVHRQGKSKQYVTIIDQYQSC